MSVRTVLLTGMLVVVIGLGTVVAYSAYYHILNPALLTMGISPLLQAGAVGSVFSALADILYIAFFWLVVMSIIAGGIEMATSGASPILNLFGIPVPRVKPETGFRTMFTAVVAWEIVNILLQTFGVSFPPPISLFPAQLTTITVAGIGTLAGLGLGAGFVFAELYYALRGTVEVVV